MTRTLKAFAAAVIVAAAACAAAGGIPIPPNPELGLCADPNALNYNQAGNCIYDTFNPPAMMLLEMGAPNCEATATIETTNYGAGIEGDGHVTCSSIFGVTQTKGTLCLVWDGGKFDSSCITGADSSNGVSIMTQAACAYTSTQHAIYAEISGSGVNLLGQTMLNVIGYSQVLYPATPPGCLWAGDVGGEVSG